MLIYKHLRQRAFSLVELLVVVAIAGILTSLGIANFKEYRSRTFDTEMRSYVHNAAIAHEAYKANDIKMNYGQISLQLLPTPYRGNNWNTQFAPWFPGLSAPPDASFFYFVTYGNNLPSHFSPANKGSYNLQGWHCKGSRKTYYGNTLMNNYIFDSRSGKMQVSTTNNGINSCPQ